MKSFQIHPSILMFDDCAEFVREAELGERDLILTNRSIFEPCFGSLGLKCPVIYQEDYGKGEPSEEMAEAIAAVVQKIPFDRLIAIGGGTVIDLAKLFTLDKYTPIADLFDRKWTALKVKKLWILPTTCGTGSEITNISILAFPSRNTKFGLSDPALFADTAVLIPEVLEGIPFSVFATSSIDALVHAVESGLSPKANPATELYSYEAIRMIIEGYQKVTSGTPLRSLLGNFQLASTYAGIAFSNAGCAAVHAMSYPLGACFHVPHGESNYAMFTGVMNKYMELQPHGRIEKMNAYLANLLHCESEQVYSALEKLLDQVLQKKALHEYGVTEGDLHLFTRNVMEKQGRLMANNYTALSEAEVLDIYRKLY